MKFIVRRHDNGGYIQSISDDLTEIVWTIDRDSAYRFPFGASSNLRVQDALIYSSDRAAKVSEYIPVNK